MGLISAQRILLDVCNSFLASVSKAVIFTINFLWSWYQMLLNRPYIII